MSNISSQRGPAQSTPQGQQWQQGSPQYKRSGSLRFKTLLVIVGTLSILLLVVYIPVRSLLLASFQRLEERTVLTDMERVRNVVALKLSEIDHATQSWSNWDDTYFFVDSPNDFYISSNTSDNRFVQYNINLMIFANRAGEVVFSKALDLESRSERQVPPALLDRLTPDSPLLQFADNDSGHSGLVMLPEGPLLITSRPVLSSTGGGQINGAVLFGRYLDQAEIERLGQLIKLPFMVTPVDQQQLSGELAHVRAALLAGGTDLVLPKDEQTISGYTLFSDIEGAPALIARLDLPREVYGQGQGVISQLSLAILVGGVLLGIAMMLLLERLILRRLIRLRDRVSQIGSSGDMSARVDAMGNDELTHLGGSINDMLAAIAEMHQERQALEQKRLSDLEQSNSEQRQLLDQLQTTLAERQALSETVRALSIPVMPVLPGIVVVPLVGDFDAERAADLQTAVLDAVQSERASCVIIDVTGVPVLHAHVAEEIVRLTEAIKLLGAETQLVGIRPEVAQTLVHLDVTFTRHQVKADLQSAVQMLAAGGRLSALRR